MLKKIVKYTLRAVLILIGLIFLLLVLVYLPPVQNFIKGKAAEYVSRNMGIHLEVNRFRIRFPLTLSIDDALARTAQGDTLFGVGQLRAHVALLPLLRGSVEVRSFTLREASINLNDTLGLTLHGRAKMIELGNIKVRLSEKSVRAGSISLSDAVCDLRLGKSNTTASDTVRWKIAADRLSLDRVKFTMQGQPLQMAVDLEKGELKEADLDLSRQSINVEAVRFGRAFSTFLTEARPTDVEPPMAPPTSSSPPWSIRIGRIELADQTVTYATRRGEPRAGFDPAHIHVSDLSTRIDSFLYHGSDLSATVRKLALHERSGLEITNLKGQFAMDSTRIDLAGFDLRTPSSHIEADAHTSRTLFGMSSEAPLTIKLKASVSGEDLLMAYPADARLRRALDGRTITANADLAGQPDDLTINSLHIEIPSRITFDADGHMRSLTDLRNMSGNLRVDGQFTDVNFVRDFLPAAMRRRIGFPRRMTLAGTIGIDRGTYSPDVRIAADGGRMDIRGTFGLRTQIYNLHVAANNFPAGTFLPVDSLGLMTLDLRAKGRGFNFRSPATTTDVDLKIDRFDYKNFNHHDIALKATLVNGAFDGTLTSNNEALKLDLAIDGHVTAEQYAAHLRGSITHADLMAMHLSHTPLGGSTTLDISVEASRNLSSFKADAILDSTNFIHGIYAEKIDRSILTASGDATSVKVFLRTGDLALDFNSPASPKTLISTIPALSRKISEQLAARNIDMAEIENVIPRFDLALRAGKHNVAHYILEQRGIKFNTVTLTALRGDTTSFQARGLVTGLHTNALSVDTLNVGLRVRDRQLSYFLRLANHPGTLADLGLIYLFGNVEGNATRLNIRQRNRAGQVGFSFGVDAELKDHSSIRATFFPDKPTLGYTEWNVNEGNFIEYHFNREIYADLRFESEMGHIHILSASDSRMPRGSVRLDISHLNIKNTLELLPISPPVEGFLNTDILVGLSGGMIAAIGQVGVDSLVYRENLIGDVNANIVSNSDAAGVWNLVGKFDIDQKEAFNVKGTYDTRGKGMDVVVDIPGLPLKTANIFLPEETAQLTGTLTGNATLRGTLKKPDINGLLAFTDAKVTVPSVGTTFGISSDPIPITNSRITFRDFGLTSPNGRMLAMQGTLDVANFSEITADLDISGDNFQIVNSSRSGGSQIYGTAVVDVDVTARGPLAALVIRGDVDLLRATNVTYTMRSSPLSARIQQQDIVTFVSFADSVALAEQETPAAARTRNMNILMNVNIEQGARTTINLSENAENRIELTGGGALSYSMSSQGDTRLAGRYTISNGTVVYNPPVIAQKTFNISENSYIEWTGEAANPRFYITAVNVVPTNVITATDQRSTVDFNVIIKVENTLQNMSISFDLTAPGNSEIQTELMTLTAEQRSQQALALLAYGTYTGPGTTTERTGLNANDLVTQQLNSFISREINQWARSALPGVDLQVGAQTVANTSGSGQHTNFSYSVSKKLFSDRVTVKVGGSLNNMSPYSISENFIDDILIEYRLSRRDNIYLKLFRYNTMENIFEGQITQTGIGFLIRKQMLKMSDLFRRSSEQRSARRLRREFRRELRNEERQMMRDTSERYQTDSVYRAWRERDSIRLDSLQKFDVHPRRTTMHPDSVQRYKARKPTPHERIRTDGKATRRNRRT